MSSATPEFLFVRPGDYVAIKKENCEDTKEKDENYWVGQVIDCIGGCLLYTSPSPRDGLLSRMPSSA